MNTLTGMPIMWALANPKIGEREVLAAMFDVDAELGVELLRPSFKQVGAPVTRSLIAQDH